MRTIHSPAERGRLPSGVALFGFVIGRRFRSQNAQLTVCYDIESAVGRNRVRWSLTTEGVIRFLKKRNPEHYVIARGGKALFTGREFLDKHSEDEE